MLACYTTVNSACTTHCKRIRIIPSHPTCAAHVHNLLDLDGVIVSAHCLSLAMENTVTAKCVVDVLRCNVALVTAGMPLASTSQVDIWIVR